MSRRRGTQVEDLDEEGPSQASSSQRANQEKRRDLARDCVYYLLVADQQKHPIRKEDIKKNVLKEYRREFNFVISDVKEMLRNVYGIELVPVKESYILKSILSFSDPDMALKQSDMEYAKRAFLLIVLSHIFMNNNVVHESDMWPFLAKLGLNVEDKHPHKLFGDIKKFMQELVRQLYLEYNRIDGTEPPEYEFRAGLRAKLEISKYDLLMFFCHVNGGGMKPEDWPLHLQEATEEKNGKEN